MNMLLFVITMGLASAIFSFVFEAFNHSILTLFKPIQRRTAGLKKKRLIYLLSCVFSMVLVMVFVEMFSLNDFGFALVAGFVFATNNISFQRGIHQGRSA